VVCCCCCSCWQEVLCTAIDDGSLSKHAVAYGNQVIYAGCLSVAFTNTQTHIDLEKVIRPHKQTPGEGDACQCSAGYRRVINDTRR
jgi:hypothetical protein